MDGRRRRAAVSDDDMRRWAEWFWAQRRRAGWFPPPQITDPALMEEIRQGAEPFRYALKFARLNLTPEEERIIAEEARAGGFEAFKKAIDRMATSREGRDAHHPEGGASLARYIKYHSRKEKDMR